MKFKNFTNVDLFKVGTWTDSKGRKGKWTHKDIDDIVAGYVATKNDLHIPLKLGHDEKQRIVGDDEPAIGWIENLKRVGDKLVGDFMNVPDKLASLIEKGAYRSRSSELSPEIEIGEKKYRWLLTGVALLGGRLPAVSGLDDILALYSSEGLEHESTSEVVFYESEGEDSDDFDGILSDFNERLSAKMKGKRGAPHIRALQTALNNAINASKGGSHEMDSKAIALSLGLKEDATDDEINAKIKSLKETDEKKPEETSKNSAELTELRNQILTLEKNQAVAAASNVVDEAIKAGKLLPKQREFALNYAQSDPDNFAKFVAEQPEVVKLGEIGTSNAKVDFTQFEPTAEEIIVAKQLGSYSAEWRYGIMRTKMQAKGVEVPLNFGKEEVKV